MSAEGATTGSAQTETRQQYALRAPNGQYVSDDRLMNRDVRQVLTADPQQAQTYKDEAVARRSATDFAEAARRLGVVDAQYTVVRRAVVIVYPDFEGVEPH